MKVLVLSFIIITNFIYADLIDLYRNKGINAVEEQLSKELMKKEYWDNYLENINVDLGYYESKKYLLLTKKRSKELQLFKVGGKDLNLLMEDNVIIGEKEGDKKLRGDLKTPVGAYELTEKITKLDPFYGPLALVTNYPNTFDKIQNKKGDGIWIHGMPLNESREEFTKGCIALDNPNLKKLDKNMNFNESILLISDDSLAKASKDEISLILSSIFEWREAWKKSDIQTYLAFYSDSFKRKDGMDLLEFKDHKKRIFSKKEDKTIEFKNINIVPYPNSLNKKIFKVLMDEDYKTQNYTFNGKKELYLEVKDNKIEILTES